MLDFLGSYSNHTNFDMSDNVESLMIEVLTLPQEASRDHRLSTLLRTVSQEERHKRLDELLEKKCHSALVVLKAVGDIHTCEALLRKHLPKADASSVRLLLRLAVDIIGEGKLVNLLKEITVATPKLWDHASYWLPSMISKNTWNNLRNWRDRSTSASTDPPPPTSQHQIDT